MTNQNPDLLDKLSAEADQAEKTRDANLAYRRRRPGGGQAVYGLRLPTERIAQLRRIAGARGVEPSVLARSWVIEQLDRAEAGDRNPETDRWERELRNATEQLRQLLDERPGA